MTDDLRFPIGRFARPASFSDASRAAAIAAIAATPANLRAATKGLTEAQLDTPYRPGGWSVRQVVHHLADSHMNAYCRTRLALTEENPSIKPYDEAKWAELTDAKTGAVETSLSLMDGIHSRWGTLLDSLKPDDFSRTMMHPENGPMTLDVLLALYSWHGAHHVAHITGLRARSGF